MSTMQNLVNGIKETAAPAAQPTMADMLAIIQQQQQQVAALLAAQQQQSAPAPSKGKKEKSAKPVAALPATIKGYEWATGSSAKGVDYREASFPGSDWKLRVYTKTGAVALVSGRSLIFADGAVALGQLASHWPAGADFLKASARE